MILQRSIFTIFLATFATHAAVLDEEPPVFTYCPSNMVIDDATTPEVRVAWKNPEATDNSGKPPSISSNSQPGEPLPVPSTFQVLYEARDESGNKATCSFRITLKRKTCLLYDPPNNGALACYKANDVDYVCVAMCKNGFDFLFNPAYLYYCSVGQWQFYAPPNFPYSTQLPWPDCTKTASPSHFRLSQFYFDGDVKDPNVQTVIKTNYIFLMTAGNVPPFFCQFLPECRRDNVEVFAGASTDEEPPVFTYCPSDIVIDDATTPELRVEWKNPEATDNSGKPPSISSNSQPGEPLPVPSTFQVLYEARDESGNKATCSFRITLKRKTCLLYNPPNNGALACYKANDVDYVCVAMCKNEFDFVFNPSYLYYCSVGQWQFYAPPNFPYSTQLPWPDCTKTASPSDFRLSQFYFDGDVEDPNVQTVIKTNYIFLMTAGNVPPFFCQFLSECREDNVEVFAGASTDVYSVLNYGTTSLDQALMTTIITEAATVAVVEKFDCGSDLPRSNRTQSTSAEEILKDAPKSLTHQFRRTFKQKW